MACNTPPIPNTDLECSFVEREKHRIDVCFQATVSHIEPMICYSIISFNRNMKITVYSEIRHIFDVGQQYRVSIWNDGSADFELLENEL